VNIIFKGRRTDVQERFRKHASAKLGKIEKLDHKTIEIDVEVSQERNPRLSGQWERVELTIRSRGPVIRAEAAADDRYVALDRALAKLEQRMRRSGDRRKAARHGVQQAGRASAKAVAAVPGPATGAEADAAPDADAVPEGAVPRGRAGEMAASGNGRAAAGRTAAAPQAADGVPERAAGEDSWPADDPVAEEGIVPIQMEGDGPLVVREKFHTAAPMSVEQALLAMELVGHDFYLFRDEKRGLPSVVYRRHGYQYGLIRLVDQTTADLSPG
jgi:ribosomal subunit interface protein